jgi:predicted acylesterase/phospholipase RssA
MAGHLYYMGQMAPLSGRFQPRVFTGASAGAINSMVGMLSTCGADEPNPTRSLYWNAWTSIGIDEIFVSEKTTATGMLTTDAYQPILSQMRMLWQAGLPTSCDVVLGVVITRTEARNVVLAPGFPPLPLSREAVLVLVTGQGPGRPPLVRNQVDSTRATGQLLLPLDGPDAQPFESLAQLVLASAAFPLGFSPVSVRHCIREAGTPANFRCTPDEAVSALFMDGGIFDNQPLGLAVDAMRTIGYAPPGDGRFYFLDPRVRSYPSAVGDVEQDDPEPEDVLDVIGSLLGLLSSAEARELISTFEHEPQLRDRLLLARTYFPQISSTFTGLLDRSFREFDFYLGMYNAARSIREHPLGAGLPELDAIVLADGDSDLRDAWRPYQCLRAVLDGVGDSGACDGDELTDFRILLQLTLDRLTEVCRRAERSDATLQAVDHPHCRAAMEGVGAPLVKGVRIIDDAEKIQLADESELDYQLRLLGRYGFHFRDLGLDRDQAHEARDRVIRLTSRMLQRFSDVQPRVARSMGVLTRIGVDVVLGYLPPVHSFHITVGVGAEFGYSVTIDDRDWSWLRFGAALGFDGLSTFLSPSEGYFAVIPKAGPEFEVLGRPDMQIRMGARAGYQFSSADDFTSGECDFTNESNRPCSRLMTEAYAAMSILGFLRIQLAGVFGPGLRTGQSDYWAMRPTVGMQFNSPF